MPLPELELSSDRVNVDLEDRLCTIELCDPEGYNPITRPVLTDLRNTLSALPTLEATACVIVSRGAFFSTGGDHRQDDALGREALREFLAELADFYRLIVSARVPIIVGAQASSHGAATDALVLADHAIVASDALIGFGHVKYGMAPLPAIVATLVARVGLSRARRLLISGEQMTGAAAFDAGLVDEVTPASDVRTHALSTARDLAALPTVALERARMAFDTVLSRRAETLQEQIDRLTKRGRKV